MEHIEDQRRMQMSGKLKSSDISAGDWKKIQEHDQLMAEVEET